MPRAVGLSVKSTQATVQSRPTSALSYATKWKVIKDGAAAAL